MMLIMKDMRICIGSDGYGFSYDRSITNTNPHPRSFGTFPGFLRIVRESGLMPLEDAVYKLTGLPASFLGMKDRGTLEVGKVADLTVFDSENVRDTSTFLDSVRKPEGIFHVLVAGQFAMRDGEATGVKKGTVLLKK
jgi:N-acyl-D-amino-acid deacylase